MKIEVELILVKTDKVAPLIVPTRGYGKGSVFHNHYYGRAQIDMGDEYHNLFFASNEDIKKGELMLQASSIGWLVTEAGQNISGDVFDCKKIEATTDHHLDVIQIPESYAKKYACALEKPKTMMVELVGDVMEVPVDESPVGYSGIQIHVGDIDEDQKAKLMEELREGMKRMSPITIQSGYRDINWVPKENNWDEIFKIMNNPDVSAGTKEAMIREKFHSPSKKSTSPHLKS